MRTGNNGLRYGYFWNLEQYAQALDIAARRDYNQKRLSIRLVKVEPTRGRLDGY